MNEMALPQYFNPENKRTEFDAFRKRRNHWLAAFFISAGAGACASVAGLIISALETLALLQISLAADYVAMALIVAAFPLMAFASHCLDKAAEVKKAIKAISYTETYK